MIAIIDYGMGNLRSVQKALESMGAKATITQKAGDIANAEKVVLPGVGAMQPAIKRLGSLELIPIIKKSVDSGKPFLGICLGLQLLFEKSNEGGNVSGLGILKGGVEQFTELKVPHMGWNQIRFKKTDCPLLKNIKNEADVYFCHSFFVKPEDPDVSATTTDYGIDFTSAVWKDNLFAVQFHPEKSQDIGLAMLKNFIEI